ncbi:hypothetical protein AOLI_G00251860 [Acnodon oligacanthus]
MVFRSPRPAAMSLERSRGLRPHLGDAEAVRRKLQLHVRDGRRREPARGDLHVQVTPVPRPATEERLYSGRWVRPAGGMTPTALKLCPY